MGSSIVWMEQMSQKSTVLSDSVLKDSSSVPITDVQDSPPTAMVSMTVETFQMSFIANVKMRNNNFSASWDPVSAEM